MLCAIRSTVAAALAGAFVLLQTPAAAAADPYDGQWRYTLTPYLWLPNINGKLHFDNFPVASGFSASADADTGPNDYLSNLKFALMLAGEARRGPWAVFSDLIYLNFGNDESKLTDVQGAVIPRERNVGTESSLEGGVWSVAASYTAYRTSAATMDVFAGARYLGVKATLDWRLDTTFTGSGFTIGREGHVSKRVDLVDGIVGVRGRLSFGDGRWYVPYYADIGGGSSATTWQALAGLGYAFGWGDVLLVYRHLEYDQSGGKLLQNIRFDGPALGLAFHF